MDSDGPTITHKFQSSLSGSNVAAQVVTYYLADGLHQRSSLFSPSYFKAFSAHCKLVHGIKMGNTAAKIDQGSENLLPHHDLTSMMRGWTNACDRSHRRCRTLQTSPRTASSLPARVIDVGEGANDLFLHVITASDGNSSVRNGNIRYLALSYCWGDNPPPKTLTTNVDDHCQPEGLRFSGLPRTFRDAVHTARALRVRYLWIDSLCILQDSPEDVAKEVAKMHEIFRGAYAVLAAVDGRDSHLGLNIDQDVLPRRGIPEQDWACFWRPATRGRDGVLCRSLHSIQQGVWRTRAWTLQEEMLAGRIIYFTHPSSPLSSSGKDKQHERGQILWSCAERIWSEDGKTRICVEEDAPFPLERFPPNIVVEDEGHWGTKFPEFPKRVVDILLRSADKRLYQAWYALAEEYSRRRLTCLADKVYAIEGLARRHGLKMGIIDSSSFDGNITGDDACPAYLCGLWRDDITWGLSWMSTTGARWRDEKGPLSKLPTWSWTSVDGPVSWDVYDTPRLYTVLSTGKSTAQSVLHWHVVVQGQVLRNKRFRNGSYKDSIRGRSDPGETYHRLDETYHFETDPSGFDEVFQLLASVRSWKFILNLDLFGIHECYTEWTMILLKKLEPSNDGDEAYYSRVGWCTWRETVTPGITRDARPISDYGRVEQMTLRLV